MKENIKQVLWVAHQCFDRGLVTGSTGNISFRDGDYIYISKSGSSFGLLDENDFVKISLNGKIFGGKPSKEYPLHLALYKENPVVNAVIHTHSFYSTWVSCMTSETEIVNGLLSYTPYLQLKTNGNIGIVAYYEPGSKELFDAFSEAVDSQTSTYVLKNHGVVIGSKDIIDAFYIVEEFETSAKLLFSILQSLNISFDKIVES